MSSLKNRLKKVSTTTGDGVARAFLKTQAALFGCYRNALQIQPVRQTEGERKRGRREGRFTVSSEQENARETHTDTERAVFLSWQLLYITMVMVYDDSVFEWEQPASARSTLYLHQH